jgi:methionyl-tRNA formyltransferase
VTALGNALLVGSKAIAVAASDVLRDAGALVGIITLDDSEDTRSRLPDLVARGAQTTRSRSEANTAMASVEADWVLVAGWYWIIESSLLAARPHIGIHHSLLPRFRGGSPLIWSLLQEERTVGTSLFTLTDTVDAGDVWAQQAVAVDDDAYVADVLTRCDDTAIQLLHSVLDGSTEPRPQDERLASWCTPRHPEDGRVDWGRSASTVARSIRAQSRPYPGAFAESDAGRVRLWRARPDERRYYGAIGEVVSPGNGQLAVICGDGRLAVIEEFEGGLRRGLRLF